MGRLIRHLATLVFLLYCGSAALADHIQMATVDAHRLFSSPDALLAKTLQEIRASRLDKALIDIDQLISIRPDFKLAHLIKGDLLMARARPIFTLGATAKGSDASLTGLREEARARLLRYLDEPDPSLLPKQILQLDNNQKYALLADAARARLYLFENDNGVPRLVRDYYMTIGSNGVNKRSEGDKKTPVGVYLITQFLPREKLTDFYGAGAYPLNYPNDWDQLQARGGSGIWLHGTPSSTYSRPPRASDGCVVLANPDLIELGRYLQVGTTPLVIADRTDWVRPVSWEASRQEVLATLEKWRSDWESRDAQRFLENYSAEFLKGDKDWGVSKQRNIANKDWIKVDLSDMSIFLYPDSKLAVTTFRQTYTSDSHNSTSLKRLYWRLDDGKWRIALEKSLPSSSRLAANSR